MHATPDARTFNEAVKDGTVGQKMHRILETLQPEAVYFTEIGGERSCYYVVDIPDAAKIPFYSEPWFLSFDAKVELHPCISPEDLNKSNLEDLGKKWR